MIASIAIENAIPAAPNSMLSQNQQGIVKEPRLGTNSWRRPNFSIVKTAIHEAAKYSIALQLSFHGPDI